MGIKLIGIDGPLKGKMRELTAGTYKIGRGPECDVRLDSDGNASREHAILRVRNGLAEVEDTGSTNGTWVNEVRVLQERVTEGDTLKVGDSVFQIKSFADVELDRDISDVGVKLTPAPPPERYAGFWARLGARIIDFIVVALLYGLLGGLVGLLFYKYAGALIDFEHNLTGSVLYAFLGAVVWLVAYPTWMDGTSGQTIGRMCMGIWVATEDRGAVTTSEALVRHVLFVAESLIMPGIVYGIGSVIFAFAGHPSDAAALYRSLLTGGAVACGGLAAFTYFLLYYILLAADTEKRGWHDKSAGTVVLHK